MPGTIGTMISTIVIFTRIGVALSTDVRELAASASRAIPIPKYFCDPRRAPREIAVTAVVATVK